MNIDEYLFESGVLRGDWSGPSPKLHMRRFHHARVAKRNPQYGAHFNAKVSVMRITNFYVKKMTAASLPLQAKSLSNTWRLTLSRKSLFPLGT